MVFGIGHSLTALILDWSKIIHVKDIGQEHDFGHVDLNKFFHLLHTAAVPIV